MSDVIETTEEVTYPKPKKTYVRNGRCTYCGSKKIKTLYGYDWCDKPCSIGKLGLKNYEMEHHLGAYAIDDVETGPESEGEND